jgi:ribonuclease BN (tRNA processing enzyme)
MRCWTFAYVFALLDTSSTYTIRIHHALSQTIHPPCSVAGSIFMAPRCLHQDSVFQDCMKGIPGMKLFAQQPGYHDQCRGGLGFMSSTRTTIRLNLISGLVFPLPAVFREEVAEESKVAATYADEALRDAASGRETKALVDEPDQRGLFADNNLTLKQKALHVVTGLVDVAWSNGMPDVRCVHTGWSDSVDVRALQKEALERSVELRPMLEHMKRCVPACQPTAASDQTYPMGHALVDDACGAGANAHAASMQALLPTKRPLGCGDGRSSHREAHTKQQSPVTNRGAAIALKARLQGREPHPANDGDVVVAATPRPQSQPIAVDARLRSTVPVTEWPRGKVTFLGTGCAEPSKYRGASSILVSTSSNRSMLLDCGEGAWGQLVRLHGFTRATAILSSLDAVWISHRHADHMSGILQILLRTVQYKDPSHPPLLLIGPRALGDWLREAAPPLGLRHNERYSFIHFSELQKDARHPARSFLNSTLGFSQIACVPVRHCSDAYGIVLKHVEGWSLVYSGDTEPSEALMRAGSGATLLIHEATFEPALVAEARNKRHSTVSEALHVAQRMGAYCTILTHFSQRYPKFPEGLPVIDPGKVGFGGDDMVRVAPAFDGMCVPLHALGQLPLLTPGMALVLGGGGNAGGLDGAAGDPGACC